MKKGSRAIRCFECGKIVGWKIPTGKVHHDIPQVEIRIDSGSKAVFKNGSQYFYCDSCKHTN